MRAFGPITLGIAVVLTAAACGGGAPPVQTPPPVNQDSIDAARRRQDSIMQAEQAARRDSVARADERERAARQAAQDSMEAARAAVAAENEAVRMTFATTIHFDFDRSEIKPEWIPTLDAKVAIMMANPAVTISVIGHCDERGSDEYNIALGNRRALAVKRYMVDRGIAANRIQTSSMGESQPLVNAHNEDAWAQNRRDEFRIVGMANLVRPGM